MDVVWRLLVFIAFITLAGCQARTTVDISAHSNGSGSVSVTIDLDQQATAAVPNLSQQLQGSDLKKAGWSVSGPARQSGGHTVVKVRHGFSSVTQANQLMAQLTGADGAFRNFKLTRQRSLNSVKTDFTGQVNLSNGIQSFGSAALAQKFGNSLGFDTNELQQNTGADLTKTFPVDIAVHLPGNVSVNPQRDSDGSWHLAYGTVTQLTASGSSTNVKAIVFLIIAVGLILAAIAVALVWKTYVPKHKEGGLSAADFVAHMKDDDE